MVLKVYNTFRHSLQDMLSLNRELKLQNLKYENTQKKKNVHLKLC